mmetsp:Transcript_88270/g.175424  ORF Transcript_88270/g.175424 Transcript_88270/m.175424 type:complete len:259 (+) Transcript_88270:416-1192(+)
MGPPSQGTSRSSTGVIGSQFTTSLGCTLGRNAHLESTIRWITQIYSYLVRNSASQPISKAHSVGATQLCTSRLCIRTRVSRIELGATTATQISWALSPGGRRKRAARRLMYWRGTSTPCTPPCMHGARSRKALQRTATSRFGRVFMTMMACPAATGGAWVVAMAPAASRMSSSALAAPPLTPPRSSRWWRTSLRKVVSLTASLWRCAKGAETSLQSTAGGTERSWQSTATSTSTTTTRARACTLTPTSTAMKLRRWMT